MAEERASEADRRYIAAAIRFGASALGTTWPNPAVGALVVKDGVVLGRGRTGQGGRPHGETMALAEAGPAARGATLYVSLEPCAHFGKTPPCTDAIIAAGIARVVASAEDPDPRVAGRGFQRLREEGIEVLAGVLIDEARQAQAGHISRVALGRPHVLLKLAVSAEDAIGRTGEGNVPITGDSARRYVQALRSRFDAILVGRGTVDVDDPELTCRLPGLEHRSPVRVVLDSRGRLADRRVLARGAAATWVLGTGPDLEGDNVRRLHVEAGSGGIDLRAGLARLGAEGITRLMVEGGGEVARSLLEADLVDKVLLFRSPLVIGGEIVPAFGGLPLPTVEHSDRFRRTGRRSFGGDRMTRYLRAR